MPTELKVTGSFPTWTIGSLVCAEPWARTVNRLRPEDGKFSCDHWFDGFAHTHKFEIVPGDDDEPTKVLYQSRRHMDKALEDARRTGRLNGKNLPRNATHATRYTRSSRLPSIRPVQEASTNNMWVL